MDHRARLFDHRIKRLRYGHWHPSFLRLGGEELLKISIDKFVDLLQLCLELRVFIGRHVVNFFKPLFKGEKFVGNFPQEDGSCWTSSGRRSTLSQGLLELLVLDVSDQILLTDSREIPLRPQHSYLDLGVPFRALKVTTYQK